MRVLFEGAKQSFFWSLIVSSIVFVVATGALAQSIPAELVSYPELILHNGKVLTVDDAFSIAQAVAVRDGRFLKVGTDQEVLALKGPATQVIDLEGRSVVPGFIDTHGHGHFLTPRGAGLVDGGRLTWRPWPAAWKKFGRVRQRPSLVSGSDSGVFAMTF